MQTLREIRERLTEAGLKPRRQFGQNFLIDQNLMRKLLELAEPSESETVLEVGPGTGALTEELLVRAGRVVAVEIDRGLSDLLRQRLADRENFVLLNADVLAGKHAINPDVLDALPPSAHLVSNLPYGIATPLLAQCLLDSWRARAGGDSETARLFERMTFTVQREVADRLTAGPGSKDYGPVSVLVALLGRITPGPVVPAEAFWPRPNVTSRILRLDFDPAAAAKLANAAALRSVLALLFGHRRKQMGWALRREDSGIDNEALRGAMDRSDIKVTDRAEQVPPEAWRGLANALSGE